MKTKVTIKKSLIKRAESALKESKNVDFKTKIDINKKGDWCELIKDIVALANSGGGIILIGVNDSGKKSDFDFKKLLDYDNAKITDKISSYIDIDYSDFELIKIRRPDGFVVGFIAYQTYPPIIFSKPGDYSDSTGKQKSAFQKGILYVRRGSRSIPAKSADLIKILEQEISIRRKQWLGNIRKVIQSPSNYDVHVVNKNMEVSINEKGTPVRLTTNPDAPEFRITNPDTLCPYNTTKTVDIINEKLRGKWKITNYDILMVRYLFDICDNPDYYYHPTSGSSQYSDKFIEWIIDHFKSDKKFFTKNRKKHRNSR